MRRKLTKKEKLAATLATGERPKLDRYINVRFNNAGSLTTSIVYYLEGKAEDGRKIRARRGEAQEVVDLHAQVYQAYAQATTVGVHKDLPAPSPELPPLGRRVRMRFGTTKGEDTGLKFFMGTNEDGQIVHAVLPDSEVTRSLWTSMNAMFDSCAIVHEKPKKKVRKK